MYSAGSDREFMVDSRAPRRDGNGSGAPPALWEAEIGDTRLVFGRSRLRELGIELRSLGVERVVLVSDSGIREAGHIQAAEAAMAESRLEWLTLDDTTPNPTCAEVELAVGRAAEFRPDGFVALGGGSAMDRAKAVNLLLTNGGKVTDYWGFGRASRPLLPAIGVPTTAGTGSEAQSYALISDTKTHRKMACGDRKMRFRTVILDPALPATAAQKVVAVAGIDAVSHAIESYVSTRSNPISQLFSRTAWELLDRNASSIAGREGSEEGFGELLLGAHLAGAAIEQSMLGATHACANPLTAQFDVAHGEAIAVLLPWVIRFNAEAVDGRYRSLLSGTGEQSARDYGESLACRVESIRHAASLPAALRDLDIPHSALPELAAQAADEWTARFNPRPVDQTTLLQVYESAF